MSTSNLMDEILSNEEVASAKSPRMQFPSSRFPSAAPPRDHGPMGVHPVPMTSADLERKTSNNIHLRPGFPVVHVVDDGRLRNTMSARDLCELDRSRIRYSAFDSVPAPARAPRSGCHPQMCPPGLAAAEASTVKLHPWSFDRSGGSLLPVLLVICHLMRVVSLMGKERVVDIDAQHELQQERKEPSIKIDLHRAKELGFTVISYHTPANGHII